MTDVTEKQRLALREFHALLQRRIENDYKWRSSARSLHEVDDLISRDNYDFRQQTRVSPPDLEMMREQLFRLIVVASRAVIGFGLTDGQAQQEPEPAEPREESCPNCEEFERVQEAFDMLKDEYDSAMAIVGRVSTLGYQFPGFYQSHDTIKSLVADANRLRAAVAQRCNPTPPQEPEPARPLCGCCRRPLVGNPLWCYDCVNHISPDDNLPAFERTFKATTGKPCPFSNKP